MLGGGGGTSGSGVWTSFGGVYDRSKLCDYNYALYTTEAGYVIICSVHDKPVCDYMLCTRQKQVM